MTMALAASMISLWNGGLAAFFDKIEGACGSIDSYLDVAGLTEPRRHWPSAGHSRSDRADR
jgi:hypothetical protein